MPPALPPEIASSVSPRSYLSSSIEPSYKDIQKNIYTILCLIGVGPDEEPVLAEDRVLFKGEQIAAIVAETEEAAMEAVSKVKLDLEELPAVFDVEEALKPGAPILKPWGTNYFANEGHLPPSPPG